MRDVGLDADDALRWPLVEPIVALDYPSAAPALALVRRLGDRCRFYKIGHELFTAEGPQLVRALRDAGCDLFLDLKFLDIPNTVRGGVRSAARMGVRLTTVHAAGGAEMLAAAAEGAADGSTNGMVCGVLAVTVLTSWDASTVTAAWGRAGAVDVRAEALRLAELADDAGVHGIVCSGEEVAAVRRALPRLAPLVPGIRFSGGETGDQRRVVTPSAALASGARYVVVGRAVTGAPDPAAAMERVQAELTLAR